MNIFEIFGTIAINNSGANKAITDTGSKASRLASNMKDSFEKIGKAAVKYGTIIATGLGAGMAVLLKNTYSEFADYEQLIGGVKKLFGDNWEAVSKYASEAYKKQGMSANEYMELATSFSASLISGLEGDTEKAARMADMAIQDMADNANTFGTDIEMLKNAYQGFAKGNFTMLDNLKLGYGGTAEEMARLINDSGVLGSAIKVTAETVKDLPLDVIIAAIHKIQTEMGITGTTANEAADTIAGSFAMFKASWSNLLVGLANNEDIDPLFDAFFEAGETLWKNIKKVAPKIGENLSKAFQRAGEKVRNLWVNSVWPSIQKFFKTKLGIELPSWSEIETNVSNWWTDIKTSIQDFCTWTLKLFNNPAEAVSDVEKAFSTWWTDVALPGILKVSKWTLQLFGTPVEDENSVKSHIDGWWKVAGKLVSGVCTWVLQLFGVPEDTAKTIGTKIFDWWVGAKKVVETACSWVLRLFTAPKETIAQAGAAISTWWKDVGSKGIQEVCTWTLQLFGVPEAKAKEVGVKVFEWWSGVKTQVQNACSWVLQLFKSPVETMEQAGATVSTWWKNTALPGIMKVCTWVLDLFGVPTYSKKTIAVKMFTWWHGVKETVQNVCSWVLQLFKSPKETMAQAGAAISNWWKNTALPGILSISQWTLGLFNTPAANKDDVKSHLAAWWTVVKNGVLEASAWTLSLFNTPVEDKDSVKSHLAAWWTVVKNGVLEASAWTLSIFNNPVENKDSVKSHLTAWWNVVKEGVIKASAWTLSLFNTPAANEKDVKSHIEAWWTLAKGWLASACQWTLDLFNVPQENRDSFLESFVAIIKTCNEKVGELKLALADLFEIDETKLMGFELIAGAVALATGNYALGAGLLAAAGFTATEVDKETEERLPTETDGLWETFAPYLTSSNYGTMNEAWKAWEEYRKSNNNTFYLAEFLANTTGDQSYLEPFTTQPEEEYGPPLPPGWDSGANSGFMNGWTPNGTTTEMAALITQLQATLNPENFKTAAKEGSAAGIAEGMSGVTITTGNVRLDSGALVGTILPKINVGLGGMVARGTRG